MPRLFPHRLALTVSAILASFHVSAPAMADGLKVVTDIPPIHGLVARVMQGAGTPDLILRPGASPHGYSLRPSEAAALERADTVIWIGDALTPWLEDAIDTLATGAAHLELMEAPGTRVLSTRPHVAFEAAADDHEDRADDDHGYEDQGHEEHVDQAAHAGSDDHDMHAGHDHRAEDPHVWLDGRNAIVWTRSIAGQLAAQDPANAPLYAQNAAAAVAEIEAAMDDARATLAPVKDRAYVVFHDAYQYFEEAFGLDMAGALSLSDNSDVSARRLAQVIDAIRDQSIGCAMDEPQQNPRMMATLARDTGIATGIWDPLGGDLTPGTEFYPALLRDMAAKLAACDGG